MKHFQTNTQNHLQWTMLLPALAIAVFAGGCSGEQPPIKGPVSKSSASTTQESAKIQTAPANALPAATTPQAPPATSSLLDKTKKFFGDAAEKGALQAPDAKSMVGELIGGLRQSTQQTAGDSMTVTGDAMEWANETFQSLKDQGVTSASNTSDWLSEDWSNMESWEYKIEPLDSSTDVAALEKQLNELGKRGWDCFHIDSTKMLFKKPRQSYLKRLPFKDLLRLAPLLNQEK